MRVGVAKAETNAFITTYRSVPHFSEFRDFNDFGYNFRTIPNFYCLESTGWRISHFPFQPVLLCVRALLVFPVVYPFSIFCNPGPSSKTSSQQVPILLDSILLLKWLRIKS